MNPRNLLDGNWSSHKNWVKIKKLLYFIFFFAIISLGIRKTHYGWFGERASLPNHGTVKRRLPVLV